MIHIEMIRQNTNHPDKSLRHQGRAWCEVTGQHFEAQGPAPIYKLMTLLWLHGHSGAEFEVYDDLSPFERPGGLALLGKVRNWARLVKGKSKFDQKAQNDPIFTPAERIVVAKAARRVTPQSAPSSGDQAPTVPVSLQVDPRLPGEGRRSRGRFPQLANRSPGVAGA